MKLKTAARHSTGILTVTLPTPQGEKVIPLGTTDPAEAREVLKAANVAKIAVLAKAGQVTRSLIQKLTVGGNMTVPEAIDLWAKWLKDTANSDRTAESQIGWALAWMREAHLTNRKLHSVTASDIAAWVNAKGPSKLSTRKVMLAAIRSLLKFCSIRDYLNPDPAREVRVKAKLLTHEQKESRHRTCFTEEEFKKVSDYITERTIELLGNPKRNDAATRRLNMLRFWHCAIYIGRYSGLRLGDICCLEWGSLKEPGKLIVHTDKKDTRVEIPISDKLAIGLDIPRNGRSHCFPEQCRTANDPKRRQMLSNQFRRICERAKVFNHSFHELRHTLASELSVNGSSLEEIAEALGHTSTKTTEGYIH